MEAIFGFVIGFAADLLRSLFLPTTTEWLRSMSPAAKKKANIDQNRLLLETMAQLKTLGKDPDLALRLADDAERFSRLLTSQEEVFVENAVEVIDSTVMTQSEMNIEAGRRAEVATRQMQRALLAIQQSDKMTEAQGALLANTQSSWEAYANAQAKLEASKVEGGSMYSLVFNGQLERTTIQRTAELRDVLRDL